MPDQGQVHVAGRCIVLIGMPAAGKSTVGVLLAKQLGRPFVDVDLCIQTEAGCKLQEIIDRRGLEAFCRLESRCTRQLRPAGQVVATGGSIVYSHDAMEFLSGAGVIVYLRLSLEALTRRLTDLGSRGIVMPPGETLAELYAERGGLYERWADITIDCDGRDHQGAVDAIISALDGWKGRGGREKTR